MPPCFSWGGAYPHYQKQANLHYLAVCIPPKKNNLHDLTRYLHYQKQVNLLVVFDMDHTMVGDLVSLSDRLRTLPHTQNFKPRAHTHTIWLATPLHSIV
jgi:hypothetical protein